VGEVILLRLQQVLGTATVLCAAGLPNLGIGVVDSHKVAVDKMVLMTDFLPNNGSKVGTVVPTTMGTRKPLLVGGELWGM
jgi:hypothetical protein